MTNTMERHKALAEARRTVRALRLRMGFRAGWLQLHQVERYLAAQMCGATHTPAVYFVEEQVKAND